MDGTNAEKSYLATELELLDRLYNSGSGREDASAARGKVKGNLYRKGQSVRVAKEGSHKGMTAVVTDSDWQGRVKVRIDETQIEKSYLATELEHVSGSKAPMTPVANVSKFTEKSLQYIPPTLDALGQCDDPAVRLRQRGSHAVENYTTSELLEWVHETLETYILLIHRACSVVERAGNVFNFASVPVSVVASIILILTSAAASIIMWLLNAVPFNYLCFIAGCGLLLYSMWIGLAWSPYRARNNLDTLMSKTIRGCLERWSDDFQKLNVTEILEKYGKAMSEKAKVLDQQTKNMPRSCFHQAGTKRTGSSTFQSLEAEIQGRRQHTIRTQRSEEIVEVMGNLLFDWETNLKQSHIYGVTVCVMNNTSFTPVKLEVDGHCHRVLTEETMAEKVPLPRNVHVRAGGFAVLLSKVLPRKLLAHQGIPGIVIDTSTGLFGASDNAHFRKETFLQQTQQWGEIKLSCSRADTSPHEELFESCHNFVGGELLTSSRPQSERSGLLYPVQMRFWKGTRMTMYIINISDRPYTRANSSLPAASARGPDPTVDAHLASKDVGDLNHLIDRFRTAVPAHFWTDGQIDRENCFTGREFLEVQRDVAKGSTESNSPADVAEYEHDIERRLQNSKQLVSVLPQPLYTFALRSSHVYRRPLWSTMRTTSVQAKYPNEGFRLPASLGGSMEANAQISTVHQPERHAFFFTSPAEVKDDGGMTLVQRLHFFWLQIPTSLELRHLQICRLAREFATLPANRKAVTVPTKDLASARIASHFSLLHRRHDRSRDK
jgi:hypothetical protein